MRRERLSTDRDAAASGQTSMTKDDAYHLLQSARRRAVLRHMGACEEEEFSMRDVAETIAAWEHDTTVQQLTSAERQRVYISLYQSHLPKLDEYGVVDYDQDRGQIKVRPLANVLEPYLGDGLDAPQTVHLPEETSDSSNGVLSRLRLAPR